MKIAVLIPTYKAGAVIAATLRSVFAQTRLPDEVIVVDDCSPDDTAAVVEGIAAISPVPLRLIRTETNSGGPAAPLNRGIAGADADLIATLDQDDVWYPSKLQRQAEIFERFAGVGLVIGKMDRIVDGVFMGSFRANADAVFQRVTHHGIKLGNGGVLVPPTSGYNALVHDTCFAMSCSNLMFPKSVWAAVGGFDATYRSACDYQFLERVTRDHDVVCINEYLSAWSVDSRSLSHVSRRQGQHGDELFRISIALDRGRLDTYACTELRNRIVEYGLGAAYWHRNERRYRRASRAYLGSMIAGRWTWEAVLGLGKLPLHWLAANLRQRPSG